MKGDSILLNQFLANDLVNIVRQSMSKSSDIVFMSLKIEEILLIYVPSVFPFVSVVIFALDLVDNL